MKCKLSVLCILTLLCSTLLCACGDAGNTGQAEPVEKEEEAVATPEPTPEPTSTPEPTPEPTPTTIVKTDEEKAKFPSHSVMVGNFEIVIPDGFDTEVIEHPALSENGYPEYSFGREIDTDWPSPYCHAAVIAVTGDYDSDDKAYNHGIATLKQGLIPENADIISETQNAVDDYYYAVTRYYVPETNSVTEDLYILSKVAANDGFAYIIENDRRDYEEKTDEETLFVIYDSVKNYFGIDILGDQSIFDYADGIEQDWLKYQTQDAAATSNESDANVDATSGGVASGGAISTFITDNYVKIGPGVYDVDYQNIDTNHSVLYEPVSGEGAMVYEICGTEFAQEYHKNDDNTYYFIDAQGNKCDDPRFWPALSSGNISKLTVTGDIVFRIKYDELH